MPPTKRTLYVYTNDGPAPTKDKRALYVYANDGPDPGDPLKRALYVYADNQPRTFGFGARLKGANKKGGSKAAGTSTLVLSTPAGVVDGDRLIAVIGDNTGNNTAVTAPAGWSLVVPRVTDGTVLGQAVYQYAVGPGVPATHTWSFTGTVVSAGIIEAFGNAGPVAAAASQNNVSGTSIPAPTITPSANGSMVVYLGTVAALTTITPPTGFTELASGDQSATGVTVELSHQAAQAASATGIKTGTAALAGVSIGTLLAMPFTGTEIYDFGLDAVIMPSFGLSAVIVPAPLDVPFTGFIGSMESTPGHLMVAKGEPDITGPATVEEQFGLDAVLLTEQSATFSLDAVLRSVIDGSHSLDAAILKTQSEEASLDAILLGSRTDGFSLDAALLSPQYGSFGAGAVLQDTIESSHSLDAVFLKEQSDSFGLSAYLLLVVEEDFSLEAVLLKTQSADWGMSAIVLKEQLGGSLFDAIKLKTQTDDFSLSYLLLATYGDTFGMDAIKLKTQLASLDLAAWIALVHPEYVDAVWIDPETIAGTYSAGTIDQTASAATSGASLAASAISAELSAAQIASMISRTFTHSFGMDAVIE